MKDYLWIAGSALLLLAGLFDLLGIDEARLAAGVLSIGVLVALIARAVRRRASGQPWNDALWG